MIPRELHPKAIESIAKLERLARFGHTVDQIIGNNECWISQTKNDAGKVLRIWPHPVFADLWKKGNEGSSDASRINLEALLDVVLLDPFNQKVKILVFPTPTDDGLEIPTHELRTQFLDELSNRAIDWDEDDVDSEDFEHRLKTRADVNLEATLVQKKPSSARYSYFVEEILRQKAIWGLRNSSNNWVMLGDGQGKEYLPVWPNSSSALQCASGDWEGACPSEISLSDWLDKWLPGLDRDGRTLSVYPTANSQGLIVPPLRHKQDLCQDYLGS